MGKGFQNFMSKKDFHPSAWWNLKKVWEAKQKKDIEEKRQDELRAQYEKEQDILNNKALLGDEKAKLGLSFMYEAPAGINKKEENKPEPKFEWQRKYNAPREEWAKNNELIQDQPFGIQVRNVRCVKCKTWGHLNTDRECPLYNMSGNSEDPGYANNPSDLIRTIQGEKNRSAPTSSKQAYSDTPSSSKASSSKQSQRSSLKKESSSDSDSSDEYEEAKPIQPIAKAQLANDMAEEHGFKFKNGILHGIRVDEVLLKMSVPIKKEETPTVKTEDEKFEDFVRHMDEKQRSKLLKKVFGGGDSEPEEKSKKKKHKKEHKKEHKKKEKKAKDKKRRHRRDSSTSEDRHKKKRRRRHDSDSD